MGHPRGRLYGKRYATQPRFSAVRKQDDSGTNDIASLITVSAGVLTNAQLAWNSTYRACTATTTGALINVGGTTSTGVVKYNTCMTLDASTPIICVTTVGFGFFENYISGALVLSGLLNPVNA